MDKPKQYLRARRAVEAVRLGSDNVEAVAKWCNGEVVTELNALDPTVTNAAINVPTVFGPVRLSEGYYLVKEENGGFRVYNHATFIAQFEEPGRNQFNPSQPQEPENPSTVICPTCGRPDNSGYHRTRCLDRVRKVK